MKNRIYIAIDLKSFYASVECVERGLDPLTTNLVVADISRTEKTICLAVSPSLKTYGIPGRARLFEVKEKVRQANAIRRSILLPHDFSGGSYDDNKLKVHPELSIDYIVAPPRMEFYINYSTRIYSVYLKYIAPEDIHVYSIDEVFIDATKYIYTYKLQPRQLAMKIIHDVLNSTGITATAGIGTNMYLCKIAMDIVAKHIAPDKDGVRIAELDEISYRKQLWSHQPITDFWRIGNGYAKKLYKNGLYTMGDIARCSIGKNSEFYSEELLYSLFGINAELLIDHAWGYEPCTISDVKKYVPASNSISSGQVLQTPYPYDKIILIIREMADVIALDLVDKHVVTDQLVLDVGYDIQNLSLNNKYNGELMIDKYGRKIPKISHGTQNIGCFTSSSKLITESLLKLLNKIADHDLLVRKINISANHVIDENDIPDIEVSEQLDLFTDYEKIKSDKMEQKEKMQREKQIQKTVLDLKKRYGKNAVLKGMNLEKGATTVLRNNQIGGHKK